MMDEIEKKAISVTGQVFETMFFTPVAVQEKENEDFYGPIKTYSAFLRGEIGFDGTRSGTLILSVPVDLAKTMASNFMGLEEESASDSQAIDMVNELCNMICGNLFSQLDKKTVWHLTVPQTREISGQAMGTDGGDRTLTVHFNAEGYPVQLQIQLASTS
ncbi:MAG: chemotaxis protein CheX [Deltaproteobacteria bacterium]|nr:chemotaxis protein CheX [Deltaproteobacteria bacterium]